MNRRLSLLYHTPDFSLAIFQELGTGDVPTHRYFRAKLTLPPEDCNVDLMSIKTESAQKILAEHQHELDEFSEKIFDSDKEAHRHVAEMRRAWRRKVETKPRDDGERELLLEAMRPRGL